MRIDKRMRKQLLDANIENDIGNNINIFLLDPKNIYNHKLLTVPTIKNKKSKITFFFRKLQFCQNYCFRPSNITHALFQSLKFSTHNIFILINRKFV